MTFREFGWKEMKYPNCNPVSNPPPKTQPHSYLAKNRQTATLNGLFKSVSPVKPTKPPIYPAYDCSPGQYLAAASGWFYNCKKANVMLYTIWYNLYNLKCVKNTHGRVLPSLKLFKLCECCFYQIAQSVSNKECKDVMIFPILEKNYGDFKAKKWARYHFDWVILTSAILGNATSSMFLRYNWFCDFASIHYTKLHVPTEIGTKLEEKRSNHHFLSSS